MILRNSKLKFRFLLYIAFFSVFFSCIDNEKSKERKLIKVLNEKYVKAFDFFEDSFIQHFPNKLADKKSSFTYSFTSDMGNLELILLEHLDEKHIAEKLEIFRKKASINYNANDSCLLVVNRFVNKDCHYRVKPTPEQLEIINLDCYKGKYPVPNFWHNEYTTELSDCKLPSDFDIYVFESKAGKYHKDENLSDGNFMPPNWKNGFSRGVAISEERSVVIYWLIIW